MLPHLNATSQAHSYSIPPITFYSQLWGSRPHLIDLTFKCEALNKKASITILKIFDMAQPGIEPTASYTPGERSTTEPLGAVTK